VLNHRFIITLKVPGNGVILFFGKHIFADAPFVIFTPLESPALSNLSNGVNHKRQIVQWIYVHKTFCKITKIKGNSKSRLVDFRILHGL
jgi:hypothetical protein